MGRFTKWNQQQQEEAEQRKEAFLEAFNEHKWVTLACKKIGISYSCLVNWRQVDKEFNEVYQKLKREKRIELDDQAELALARGILDGEPSLIRFYNQTRNGYRGYKQADVSVEVNKETNVTNIVNNISIETEADLNREIEERMQRISNLRKSAFPEINKK